MPDPTWAEWQRLLDALDAQAGTAAGVADLFKIEQLRPLVGNGSDLADRLSRLVASRQTYPDVRSTALTLRRRVDLASGREAEARRARDSLGMLQEGFWVGPFENDGGSGHLTAYDPETRHWDPRLALEGRDRSLQWHPLPPEGSALVPHMDGLLGATQNVTFYVAGRLHADTAGTFRVGWAASGASRLWVDGRLVASDDDDHPARLDQVSSPVRLTAGDHSVLLKVSTLGEKPAFALRVWDPSTGLRPAGAGWTELAEGAFLVDPSSAPVAASSTDPTVEDLANVAARTGSAADLDAWATVLSARRGFHSPTRLHRVVRERAIAAGGGERELTALAADIADDENERRQALEKAVRAAPSAVEPRVALGRLWLDARRPDRAWAVLEPVLLACPGSVEARLAAAESLAALGDEGQSLRRRLDLADAAPAHPMARLEAARAARQLGQAAEARRQYEVLLESQSELSAARAELLHLVLDQGDVPRAVELTREQVRADPFDVQAQVRLVQLLTRQGDHGEARRAADEAVERFPLDPRPLEVRGDLWRTQGNLARVLSDWRAALAIRPQNAALRERLRAVDPFDDFAAPYLSNPEEAVRMARRDQPLAEVDARVLVDRTVVRVFDSGLAARVHQRVVLLDSPRGVDGHRVQSVRYAPGSSDVRVDVARIHRADGSIVEAHSESDQSIGPSSGMYFDERQRVISFPNLRPGDAVELVYREDDTATQNMFADYFGDLSFLQGTDPRQDWAYVLIAPARRAFTASVSGQVAVDHLVRSAGDAASGPLKVWTWSARHVPRIDPEPKMRGWVESAATLHISTFADWDAVGRFWWGLAKDQLHVTPAVARAAEDAVAGIPPSDVRGRVDAVYRAVVRNTRYVGLEFGIHGFKPYKVDRILARRFGDCKDKASLMYAFLKHLGIPSRLVLIRTRNLGHVAASPASLAVFNHAILYVPGLDLYLDGTAEFSGSHELPASDQGAQALVVDDKGGPSRWVVTPLGEAQMNLTAIETTIQLRPDGSARIEGRMGVSGAFASAWRRQYESPQGRRERFSQAISRQYPGAQVVDVQMQGIDDLTQVPGISFVAGVPAFMRPTGAGGEVRPLGEPSRLAEQWAALALRRFVLDLGVPSRTVQRVRVELPAGWSWDESPAPSRTEQVETHPAFRVRTRAALSDHRLELESELEWLADRVIPLTYPVFRSALIESDRLLSRAWRVRLPSTPGPDHTEEADRSDPGMTPDRGPPTARGQQPTDGVRRHRRRGR